MSSAYEPFPFDLRSEQLIVEFDQARRENATIDLDEALAQVPAEIRPRLITEMACVDLEHTFEQEVVSGRNSTPSPCAMVSSFIAKYPQIFQTCKYREEVAKEHYRLCRAMGHGVSREEIAQRYGLNAVCWGELPLGLTETLDRESANFPQVGATFCGYYLIAELGRGALARVYVARQPDLAERWVVLKITQRLTMEAEKLACLQHSGIIPVYSIHQADKLYCICMPYLGAITLGNLLADGRLFNHADDSTQSLVSTLVAKRLSTIVSTLGGPTYSLSKSEFGESSLNTQQQPTLTANCDEMTLGEQLGLAELADSLQRHFLNQNSVVAKVGLMKQLAEAMGYAHSRHIVHRDLKPENLLIANDGRLIVLDFNLAASDSSRRSEVAGGTLPYMSPQQLRSLNCGGAHSPQDDVFAMGVIFYQLLTGKMPFEQVRSSEVDFEAVALQHATVPTSCRTIDATIAQSLDAIVMKCLASNEQQRYPSAKEVCDDLQCFVDHRVLMHASDRSPMERLQKFVKRNPVFTSTTTVMAMSTMVVAGLIVGLLFVRNRATKLEASARVAHLRDSLPETLAMLRSPGGELELIANGIESATTLLQAWQIADRTPMLKDQLKNLTDIEQAEVMQHLGDLLFAMASAEAQLAFKDQGSHDERIVNSIKWNRMAAELVPELHQLTSFRQQSLESQLQQTKRQPTTLEIDQIKHSDNHFLLMLVAREQGNTERWLYYADQLVNERPADPTRWFTLASARLAAGDLVRACDAFDVSVKLQPKSATALFWRGVARLQAGEASTAREDFSQCIALRPDWVPPRYNRALSHRVTMDFTAALDDLDWIVAAGQGGPRVFSLRSQIHSATGERVKAAEDRSAALKSKPRNADDWVSRGVLNISQEPKAALADFQSALLISPNNAAARLNIAHVQAEVLGDTNEAIKTLSTLIDLKQGRTSAIASRGILRARSGAINEALADAEWAARSKPSAIEMMQIAGIHAMAASGQTGKEVALVWLARALAVDPSLRRLAGEDSDLASLRGLQEFRALVASVN